MFSNIISFFYAAVNPDHPSSIFKMTRVKVLLVIFLVAASYFVSVGIMHLIAVMADEVDPNTDKFCQVYTKKDCGFTGDDIYKNNCCNEGMDVSSPGPIYGFAFCVLLGIFIVNFLIWVFTDGPELNLLKILKVNLYIIVYLGLAYFPSMYTGLIYSQDYDLQTGFSISHTNFCSNITINQKNFQPYLDKCQKAFCYMGDPGSKYTRCPLAGLSIIAPALGMLTFLAYIIYGCFGKYKQYTIDNAITEKTALLEVSS